MKPFRALDDDFMHELKEGCLKPILSFERKHRKSFMIEIRNNFLDLYFLGHSIEVKRSSKKGYYLSASQSFNPQELLPKHIREKIIVLEYKKWQISFDDIRSDEDFKKIMNAIIFKIITHRKGDISEGVSEVNHFVENAQNISLFLKTNVLDPTFFMNLSQSERFLEEYKGAEVSGKW